MMYKICPRCGAHLDPGEHCDCLEKPETMAPPRPVRHTPYDRAKAAVYRTGNRWATENFHATHD